MEGQSVKVYIYDLSKGMARNMSRAFLGKQIDGIWHTGIVVFDQEFYFGGMGGIESCNPGGIAMLGPPDKIVEVGKTQIPFEVFMDHLKELATTSFRGECYHLLDHNCNTFSNELSMFLTGNPIPSYITSLPQDVLSTPFGSMIRPFLESMQVNPGGHQVFPGNHGGATAGNTPNNSAQHTSSNDNQFFPKTSYLSFDTANINAIIGKLKELGEKAPAELQERTILIEQLQGLAEGKENRLEQLNTLEKILQWPSDIVFPALDVLRLSIKNPKANQHFCGDQKRSSTFLQLILSNLSKELPPANQMLALRTVCNTFQHSYGEKFLVEHKEKVTDAILKCYPARNKNIEIAASSVMLNYAVIYHKLNDATSKKSCLTAIDKMAVSQADPEANFRLLVCLGTLISGERSCIDYVKDGTTNLITFVKKCLDTKDPAKVKECASCITAIAY